MTEPTLRYNGATGAFIQVYEGKDPRIDKRLFSGCVPSGETFSFSGIRSDGTMGAEIGLFVDGTLNTKIHTSCSQPIGPGLISGYFEVVAGRSKDGGALCPVCDCDEDGDCDDDDTLRR